jgi:hypothetical protein
MDDFSLARPVGHLIMGDGSGPDGLAEKDGAKALSGAASVDTATTPLDKPSRTKRDCLKTGPEACWQVDTFSGHLTGAQSPQSNMITNV